MPRPGLQLAILLMAVPAQYLITEFLSPSSTDRAFMVKRLAFSIQTTIMNVFSIDKWKWLLSEIIKLNFTPYSRKADPLDGECAAIEVLRAQAPFGQYGQSVERRSPRPKHVKHRVGQVIKHKRFGYRGVIIGWDEKTKASEAWLLANHDNPEWRKQPSYAVLVHNGDDRDAQFRYVVEENMEVTVDTEIEHPEIDDYFDRFDGAQYLMRPWLRELYPED